MSFESQFIQMPSLNHLLDLLWIMNELNESVFHSSPKIRDSKTKWIKFTEINILVGIAHLVIHNSCIDFRNQTQKLSIAEAMVLSIVFHWYGWALTFFNFGSKLLCGKIKLAIFTVYTQMPNGYTTINVNNPANNICTLVWVDVEHCKRAPKTKVKQQS